jgi:hypothetical protein
MKHPSWEDLSGYLDNALDTHRWAKVARHLEDCQSCRDDLAELEAEHRALERVVRSDPGDEYFETFADGVAARLAVEGRKRAPGSVTRGFGHWWDSPRNLAIAGATAVVVVGTGIVLLAQPWKTEVMTSQEIAARAGQAAGEPGAAPGTPAGPEQDAFRGGADGGLPGATADERSGTETRDNEAPATDAAPPAAGAPSPAATPARAYEVKRDPVTGEHIRTTPAAPFAQEPATGGAASTLSDLKRRAAAGPLQSREESAAKSLAGSGDAEVLQAEREMRRRDLATAGRLCGEVRDPTGRPLRFASVVLVRGEATAQTDEYGRFCIASTVGSDTLVATLVGFRPARLAVRLGADVPEVVVRMQAISPLEKLNLGARTGRATTPSATAAPPASREAESQAESASPFAQLPDTLRQIANNAGRLLREGNDTREARAFEQSAAEWEKLLDRVTGSNYEIRVRHRIAEARFRAWEVAPTFRRAQAATEALTAYLTRAPVGPERDRAAEWLDQVRR